MEKERADMKRYLQIIKVKPEYRKDYIDIHLDPWREMLEAIREAGFVSEVIWYFEDQSIIYLECEDLETCDAALRATDVCKKWNMTVFPWVTSSPVVAEKVFDLNQQLDGNLHPY